MIDARPGVIGGREVPVVDGRGLHRVLAYMSPFYDWAEGCIARHALVEGVDYETIIDGTTVEFQFALEVADKICGEFPDAYAHGLVAAQEARQAVFDRAVDMALGVRLHPEPAQEPFPPPVVTLPCPEPVEAAVEHVPTKTWRKPTAAKLNKVIGPSGKQKDPRQIELF